MRLTNTLLTSRRILVFAIIELSLLSWLLPGGVIIAAWAWLCFLVLVIVYLFDITFHRIGAKS